MAGALKNVRMGQDRIETVPPLGRTIDVAGEESLQILKEERGSAPHERPHEGEFVARGMAVVGIPELIEGCGDGLRL
jgi:hypothetical protein